MSKNFVPILLLTLITVTVWVTFQIFKITTSPTIPVPTQKQLEKLDPTLDKDILEDLETSLK